MSALFKRHRRLRRSAGIRAMVRETVLQTDDLIYPLFVVEGSGVRAEIPSMPGVYHYSLDQLKGELDEIVALGIRSVILFGVPDQKDPHGHAAYSEDGIVQQAIRAVKQYAPQLVVVADTCLCQFTDHGHCGIIRQGDDFVDNDDTLPLLAQTAVSQARAGADIIAPSNMMDGFVTAIRAALDKFGFENVPVMSYAVKYASAFYGPFRDAAHSTPQFGDRKTYQMDPANAREAIREAGSDLDEGADFLMVKPALAYLDILRSLRDRYDVPLVAYHVSAEYAMIKAAAANGWIDEKAVTMETHLSMKRAGADLIITYAARQVAKWLQEGRS